MTQHAWFGVLPDRWSLQRGAALFKKVTRAALVADETITCFRDGQVTLRRNRRLTGFTEATDFAHWQHVRVGDLVIHQMDAFAGAVGVSDSEGRCSPVYAVCIPRNDADPRYFALCIRAMAWSGWIAALSRGIRVRSSDFRFETFARQVLPVPSPEEQRLIVRYLDNEELRIGSAIQTKRLMARLLRDRRDAAALTLLGGAAGTRPAFPGAPFLVPQHWDDKPFWSIARESRRTGRQELQLLSVFLDRGVIPYGEGGGQVHKPSLDLSAYQEVRPGDLVLNNQQAWRGSLGVSSHHGIVSPAYVICRLDARLNSEWANYFFRSRIMVDQFVFASRGVGSIQRQLHSPSLRRLRVAVPPIDEQTAIAAAIRSETASIDAALASIEREIALLREYRTKLVSDVVTGKKDVRAEAVHMEDLGPTELAAIRAGTATGRNEEVEEDDDAE